MPKPVSVVIFVLAVAILACGGIALGQSEDDVEVGAAPGEFEFVRLAYSGNRYAQTGRRQAWQTDWPDAEHHFLKGVNRLTTVDAAEEGLIMIPLDADIYDYPWIYAVEVGYWHLNDQEAARMRDYLLRGGFLMVDDFHGSFEWAMFKASMDRVFPDRPIVDIAEGDEAFHVLYDLDQRIQIPSRMFIYSGQTWERDGVTPHWRGIYDDHGRLMVAINHNMDIGDAWEHADWPDYPENMTALAYRFGINYLIYAMTH
ncbi:MAG: DUF4159 domain-containing protein [Woeseiaceae bacterium]|nr:DUF4159 domain-containing protein [Woeseiaceae bacterium]